MVQHQLGCYLRCRSEGVLAKVVRVYTFLAYKEFLPQLNLVLLAHFELSLTFLANNNFFIDERV